MKNRPTIFLSAVLSGRIACAAMAVIPLSAEGAPGECLLAKPKTAAPPGQFWLHLNEWGSNRRCWVLRAKLEAPSQAKGSIPVQAARIGARTIGHAHGALTTSRLSMRPMSRIRVGVGRQQVVNLIETPRPEIL